MILACSNISMAFGEEVILQNVSFHIEENEKVAVVGANGAGKTTLFRIITGQQKATEGQVVLSANATLGYLAQNQTIDSEVSVYQEVLKTKEKIIEMENKIRSLELEMKALQGEELENALKAYANYTHNFELNNGYSYKSEVVGILKGLGFSEEDFERRVSVLSGGQKTRLYLAKLLATRPNILLLDEPTNHLDIESISWLETFLTNYRGSVLLISHDRYFMDKIVTKTIEIENKEARVFNGNYSQYTEKKDELINSLLKQYNKQQAEIHKQEEVIAKLRSFNREKSIKRAESRVKMLDKIERMEKPIVSQEHMHFDLEPMYISGNDVLSVDNIAKAFGSNKLFSSISFEVKRGEKIAIVGNNGTGKTTIFKLLLEQLSLDGGEIKLGAKVKIGYYDQEHNVLNLNKTIFEEISDEYPNLSQTVIRNVMAAFMFTNDDVFKLISSLSGGERGRVSLAKLMLSEANFLLLDEPTNHLDIASKEILETALSRYSGTILFISHDRYFINRVADRVLELTPNQMVNYDGDYDYYLQKKAERAVEAATKAENFEASASKEDWVRKKEEQAKERKLKNDIANTEKEIEKLEKRTAEIDDLLVKEEIYTDATKTLALHNEQIELESKITALYEKWDELNS